MFLWIFLRALYRVLFDFSFRNASCAAFLPRILLSQACIWLLQALSWRFSWYCCTSIRVILYAMNDMKCFTACTLGFLKRNEPCFPSHPCTVIPCVLCLKSPAHLFFLVVYLSSKLYFIWIVLNSSSASKPVFLDTTYSQHIL